MFPRILRVSTSCCKRYASTSAAANHPASYCMENVRRFDYENFLCTLLLKDELRRRAFAIRGFNVEIARVLAQTSEDRLAQLRLKFWSETVDSIFDPKVKAVPDHPVAREVRHALTTRQLSKSHFERLISCRLRPRNLTFADIRQLETYVEESTASVYYLLLENAQINDQKALKVCSHLAKAQGIVNLLRSIPQLQRSQVVPVPQDILMNHGVSQERILRSKSDDKGVQACISEMAGVAEEHLNEAKALRSLPKGTKSILLPTVVVERFLARLKAENFQLTSQKLLRRDTLLPLVIYRRNYLGF